MRRYIPLWGLALSLLLARPLGVSAEEGAACEMQVRAQYQQLSSDQLLPLLPSLTWEQQLTEIAGAVRKRQTLVEIEKNQNDLAKKNLAELLEQLRVSQKRSQDLQQEVEKLR